MTMSEELLKLADDATQAYRELVAELEEQARLLGMSGEREVKLLAELDMLRKQVRELRLNRDRVIDYLERVCDGKCNAEYNPCEARELLNTIMAAPAVPEGWQLVPKTPTREMLWQICPASADLHEWAVNYEAMLSAAPKP